MKPVLVSMTALLLMFSSGCFPDRQVTEPGYEPLEARRPSVSYIVPTGNAISVPRINTSMTVWFDELMNESSVTANFGLYPILTADSISTLALDPSNPDVLYAGKMNAGILRSSNGAKSWNWASRSLERLTVTGMAVVPGPVIYAASTKGVYKSSDEGSTWALLTTGLADQIITGICVDPQQASRIFISTIVGGIYRSDDGGATWTAKNSGLSAVTPLLGEAFMNLQVHPSNGSVLYLATRNNRIYKTTDAGETWALLGAAPRAVRSISMSSLNPQTVYAVTYTSGVYRSTNSGTNWSAINIGFTRPDSVFSIAHQSRDSSILVAGASSGVVYKTINGGTSWQIGGSGVTGVVRSIIFLSSSPSTVIAGTTTNLFISQDGGVSFNGAGSVTRSFVPGTYTFEVWQDSTKIISPRDSLLVDTIKIRPYVLDRALTLWIANGRQGTPPVDPNPMATKMTFIPSEPLLKSWKYEIRINGTFETDAITLKPTRGTEDFHGNSIERDKVSNFTTKNW